MWLDVARGARAGLFYGLCYTGIALMIWAIRGERVLQANHVTLSEALSLYIVGCTGAGMIAGSLMRVARRSRVWAAVVGIIAAAPVTAAGIAMVRDEGPWTSTETIAAVLLAVAYGIGGAHVLRKDSDVP